MHVHVRRQVVNLVGDPNAICIFNSGQVAEVKELYLFDFIHVLAQLQQNIFCAQIAI